MNPIRIVSTDFDGTLVGFEPDQRRPDAFLDWLGGRPPGQVVWMINTGRWMESILDRLRALDVPADLWPEWVGCGERELYRLDSGRYQPVHPWNADCEAAHRRLALDVHQGFSAILAWVERHTKAACIYEREAFAGLCASCDAEADRITAFLNELLPAFPDLAVQRNSVYFRFCHRSYHKGACLDEVRRLTGASASESFACGDHYNDLPMLRPEVAGMLACPANAIPEVQAAVRAARGHVAAGQFTAGLVEALRAFSG